MQCSNDSSVDGTVYLSEKIDRATHHLHKYDRSSYGLTPLGLPSLRLLHLPSLGLLVILPLTPFGLLLVYPITLSMASWITGYGFMITCSVMPIWPLFEFI